MDIKSIQEKLNEEFKGTERKLIFWYDDKAEFKEDIEILNLDNAKIYHLEKDNLFYTKYFLEIVDKKNSYLIYAPFQKPEDNKNPLADMIYYSKLFYADKISLICSNLNIPERYKEHLSLYSKFWDANVRISAFAALNIERYNTETIDIGMLSVLTGVKVPSFEEILKQLLTTEDLSEENKLIISYSKMGLLEVFWELCNKYLGFSDENPTLYKLVTTLLITYTVQNMKYSVPKGWQQFLSSRKNDAAVFVRNFMNNILYKDCYDSLAKTISDNLNVGGTIAGLNVENIINCDTFEEFDYFILTWITDKLVSENLDEKVSDKDILTICKERSSEAYHFNKKFYYEYRMLFYAYELIKHAGNFEKKNNINEIIASYVKNDYKIDNYYRWFYFAYDKLNNPDNYERLRILIENIYSNDFLDSITPEWNEVLSDKYYKDNTLPRQNDFYNNYLRSSAGKERIIVIISDALRFECAAELTSKFNDDEKCEAYIEWNLGVLPSYTKLGMASLLPHEDIQFIDENKILVDREDCGDLKSRQKILRKYVPSSVCVNFDEVYKMKVSELREVFQGQDIIYIYHNQVDSRGDKASSENEVFNACDEAIVEIHSFVRRLTEAISATRYIITSDHGFLYKRDKLKESDKVSIKGNKDFDINKRFIISESPMNLEGTNTLPLNYLSEENASYVTVPVGTDIFKVSGGGQNYVHGGSSLQELIIPVIKVRTERGKKETSFVQVILTSISRKITNLTTFLDFIQSESVSDTVKPREIKAYFIDDNGKKISYEVPIIANIKNVSAEKRVFHEKFIFKNRAYNRNEKYYLVLVDANDERIEIARHEFMIDIAFADDFGF